MNNKIKYLNQNICLEHLSIWHLNRAHFCIRTKEKHKSSIFKRDFFSGQPAVCESCSRAQMSSHQDSSVREPRWMTARQRARRLILHQGWVGLIHLWSITPLRHCKNKCAPRSLDDARGLEWKCSFKVMARAVTVCQVWCTASACCTAERKFHHSFFGRSPVQLDTCFFLQLSPQLVAFLHHLCVEIFLVGFTDYPGLAMRTPSGVRQNKLRTKGNSEIPLYKRCFCFDKINKNSHRRTDCLIILYLACCLFAYNEHFTACCNLHITVCHI